MFYPLKFKPTYKDYIWGGRNLEKLGKSLPDGITAESWEVSCHPDGTSVIDNGRFKGLPLTCLIKEYGRRIIGSALPEKDVLKFPLLVKLIDASDNLSVQVHPDDSYAALNENGEYGKNEMWYIVFAEPGARLIFDVVPGTTREAFAHAVKAGRVENCLRYIDVFPGDIINIPSGLVHAIGKGIVLAEIQQNSNTTYRVYDFDRVDKNGAKRPLHIEKALEVIDFDTGKRKEKYKGLDIELKQNSYKKHMTANGFFSTELYHVDGSIDESADGSKFCIYTVIKGEGRIVYDGGCMGIASGESLLIPAVMGSYKIEGRLEAVKAYVPDLDRDILLPLRSAGYSYDDISDNVGGLYQEIAGAGR